MAPQPQFDRWFYELLLKSQYWPAKELVNFQRTHLGLLMQHARAQVPFYGTRLDAVMRPDGGFDWNRWEEIPIVTRQDLTERRDEMQALRLPPGHGTTWVMDSSGSTGKPINITYSTMFVKTNIPFYWRADTWQDVDWSETIVLRNEKTFTLATRPQGLWGGAWGPPWDPAAQRGRQADVGSLTPPDMLLEFLAKHKVAYITTGPNTIHVYAMEARRLGIRPHLRAAFGLGERVTEGAAAACLEVFGAPLYERYSSRESGRIAHECSHQHGLHVNAEKVLVEIVDEHGHACPPGVFGRVVVTPFFNWAQPLIRYEQGDMAAFGPPCSCGRTSPMIARVQGRMSAIFRHPSGAVTHALLPPTARAALRCGLWQIAQVGPLDFEVRYVPNDWDVPADEAAATAIFHASYFADARVSFVRLRQLRATPADKYLESVYEVRD